MGVEQSHRLEGHFPDEPKDPESMTIAELEAEIEQTKRASQAILGAGADRYADSDPDIDQLWKSIKQKRAVASRHGKLEPPGDKDYMRSKNELGQLLLRKKDVGDEYAVTMERRNALRNMLKERKKGKRRIEPSAN